MDDHFLGPTDPKALARLFAFGSESDPVWSPADLPFILRHQLEAQLLEDLAVVEPNRVIVERLLQRCTPPVHTFSDLLHHPSPPVELLELTKRFAKAHANAAEPLLPREIAVALYFAILLVARLRCGRRMTSMDDKQLFSRVHRLLQEPWIDSRTGLLLSEGLTKLQPA